MLGAIFGKCGEYMEYIKLDRDKSTFKSHSEYSTHSEPHRPALRATRSIM